MPEPKPFHATGREIAGRLYRIGILRWVNQSGWIVALALLLAILALRLTGYHYNEWVLLGGAIAIWLAVVLIAQKLRQPGGFQALAAWDEASQGKSVLSSAHFFEGLAGRTAGEELHLVRATAALKERRPHLSRDLPLPKPHWTWLIFVLALGFAATPYLKQPLAFEDQVISAEMAARAEAEAKDLAARQKALTDLKALSEDERKEAEALSEMLKDTGEMLESAGNKTARELLEALEERARAAEKLADKLGSAGEEWASAAMLAEMGQHADTANLAATIKDKKGEAAAQESEKIAQKLDDPAITTEVRERMDTALTRTMEKADVEDRQKPVGEHVGNASKKLARNETRPAAQDFRNLAHFFQDLAQRKKAQEDLKKLADQLRQSGDNIAQSQLQPMQQTGQQPPQGVQNLAMQPVPQMPNPGQQPPNPQGQQMPMPVPGQNPGQQPPPGMQAPVPGMGQPPGQGQQPNQQLGMMGQQPGQNGQKGMLMAPVPGQAPGSGAPSPSMMLGGGQSPGSVAGASGLEAGHGTAQMNNNTTEAMRAAKDGMVDAQVNEDGESVVRTVQGGAHREGAQRGKQEQATNFIAVEEEALDEQALPASRKAQVLRYFTALREQFETEDGGK